MHQTPKHTAPLPNSKAAAYGYVGAMASQGVTLSHTLTDSGDLASQSVALSHTLTEPDAVPLTNTR